MALDVALTTVSSLCVSPTGTHRVPLLGSWLAVSLCLSGPLNEVKRGKLAGGRVAPDGDGASFLLGAVQRPEALTAAR